MAKLKNNENRAAFDQILKWVRILDQSKRWVKDVIKGPWRQKLIVHPSSSSSSDEMSVKEMPYVCSVEKPKIMTFKI